MHSHILRILKSLPIRNFNSNVTVSNQMENSLHPWEIEKLVVI